MNQLAQEGFQLTVLVGTVHITCPTLGEPINNLRRVSGEGGIITVGQVDAQVCLPEALALVPR